MPGRARATLGTQPCGAPRRVLAPAFGCEPGKWFGSDHYPTSAIKLGAQRRTVVVLVVDAAGKATSCKVVESAGNPDLDGATCRIAMARAAFVPSRDATSRPLRSAYVLPVRWTLPLG